MMHSNCQAVNGSAGRPSPSTTRAHVAPVTPCAMTAVYLNALLGPFLVGPCDVDGACPGNRVEAGVSRSFRDASRRRRGPRHRAMRSRASWSEQRFSARLSPTPYTWARVDIFTFQSVLLPHLC
jgi:hypothetical protein